MLSFEVERAFGRILGLDFAQVNPSALTNELPGGTDGWPVMQPQSGVCTQSGGACIPNPTVLRYDDIAALNRLYPVTAQNLSSFPGKQITAASTVSIQGTVSFRTGSGMQGVNVVARPLDSNGNPLYQYTVSFVSGAYFSGNHGNPISGYTDGNGNMLTIWGSNDDAMQGYFDLSDMPLPPGASSANYQVTFEPINSDYILGNSVGAYVDGQVSPSGTLPPISVPSLAAGSTDTLTVNAADSAAGGQQSAIGTETAPRALPDSGEWAGRISQVGQSDWFSFPVRGGRTFTIVTQALDEAGSPTNHKAMPAIGIWDAFDPTSAPAIANAPGLNGLATGETWLRVTTAGDDLVRVGIADQRGDGRPDYAYNGWVLYADTVSPQRLPATGGPIVIHGMGFRMADTVLVNGQPALVTSISPNEITAIAPPAGTGVSGSVRRRKLRLRRRRRTHPAHRAHEHGADGRPQSLYRYRAGIRFDPGRRRERDLYRHQRHGNPGLRQTGLLGECDRRWPRVYERHRGGWNLVHRYGFAHQRRQPASAICRRHAPHAGCSHAAPVAGGWSHTFVDRAGAGAQEWLALGRADRKLDRIWQWHRGAGFGGHFDRCRWHRHRDADSRSAQRGPGGHLQRLPQRNQPVRRFLCHRRAARVCSA